MFIVPLSSIPSIDSLEKINPISAKQGSTAEKTENFGDVLKEKIQYVKDLEQKSLQSAYDISVGASNDLEGAMIDSAKASTAIELTTQLTTRVVNAYKEIMTMQI